MKAITKLIDKVETGIDQDLKKEFDAIILSNISNYGKDKEALKGFFNDLQNGGCQSGFINEFIYNDSCKEFYIKHIDSLEDFKTEMEEQIGESIKNRLELPHYTFMCWLCFEEYCYQVYNAIFE